MPIVRTRRSRYGELVTSDLLEIGESDPNDNSAKLAPGKSGRHEPTFFSLPAVEETLRSLTTGPLTIVAGAGVSAEAGFPQWGGLLEAMVSNLASYVTLPDGFEISDISEILEAQVTPTGRADLIEQMLFDYGDFDSMEDRRAAFGSLLAKSLYPESWRTIRPGPTARAIARLYTRLNRRDGKFCDSDEAACLLATTNFDLLLQQAVWEQLAIEARRQRLPEPARDIVQICTRADPTELTAPLVRHLHGFVPFAGTPHEPFCSAPTDDPGHPVLTSPSFLSRNDHWSETFLRERMASGAVLIVGMSLDDIHVLRSIIQVRTSGGRTGKTVALIPRSPQTSKGLDVWRGHELSELHREEMLRSRWSSLGVTTLFPDWYSQVAQFIEELIQMRFHDRHYVKYEDRLCAWFTGFSEDRVIPPTGHVTDFRENQRELNEVARKWLAGTAGSDIGNPDLPVGNDESEATEGDERPSALGHPPPSGPAASVGAPGPTGLLDWISDHSGIPDVRSAMRENGEVLAIHFWTRVPNHSHPSEFAHRQLAMTVCSDRSWQHPKAVEIRRITAPSNRLAIQAFVVGNRQDRNTASTDYQWNFVVAQPVQLDERPGEAPLTVGVITIQSNYPWTYVGADQMSRTGKLTAVPECPIAWEEDPQGSPAPVTVLRICHDRWSNDHKRRDDKTDPLTRMLGMLQRSATALAEPRNVNDDIGEELTV